MPWLELYEQGALKVKINLLHSPVVLGRDPGCGIRVNDPTVSRLQAEIHPVETGYELRNLSRNGTRVNAELVTASRTLEFGDRLYLGQAFAVIFRPDETAPDSMADNPTDVVSLDVVRRARKP